MEQLIKLVKTYRLSSGLAERLRLAEAIFHLIEPDLRAFVFSAILAAVIYRFFSLPLLKSGRSSK